MSKTKVFIPNRSCHDFSPALEFGELVYLSEGNIKRFDTSRLYRRFMPLLENSTKDDYLLVSGLTVLNLIAAFILAQKHGRLNLLLFSSNGNKKFYIERIIIGEEVLGTKK